MLARVRPAAPGPSSGGRLSEPVGSHLHYPEHLRGLVPHAVGRLFLIMSPSPDAFVDIFQVWERRVEAIGCHRSQGRHRPENQALLHTIAAERGRQSGFPLPEAFASSCLADPGTRLSKNGG